MATLRALDENANLNQSNGNYTQMQGITQYLLTTKGVEYLITSQTRIIKPPKKNRNIFYILRNKRKIISNSSYYTNGKFKTKKLKIHFKI